jgi:speckle-type POZ protein
MSPSNNIISDLAQLLVGEQGSDMAFLLQEGELRAHSLLIAARSPFLYEAVAMANKDGDHNIVVNDTTVAVFKAMLHFIYTDELPPIENLVPGVHEDVLTIAQDLLVAACSFRLDRMKAMCENLLATLVVSEENALSTLELAEDLHCSKLEHYCSEFIRLTKEFQGRHIDFPLRNRFDVH